MSANLREAAEWLAEAGYPVEFVMPNLPLPDTLWEALVDVIHEDITGKWHGNELNRQETESWLADEAGRDLRAALANPDAEEEGAEACVEASLAASGLPDDQRRHPQGQQDASEENR